MKIAVKGKIFDQYHVYNHLLVRLFLKRAFGGKHVFVFCDKIGIPLTMNTRS